ncbi:MAG: hypothetical protein ACO1NZ_11130 [Adhaeribacter sp.]
MRSLYFFLFFFACSHLGLAQSPCDENFRKGLRRQQTFTAPCDSMVLLSKAAYEKSRFEVLKLQKQVALHEKGMASLQLSLALRDSLAGVYQKEIRDFENYLKDTEGPVLQLQAHLEKSIANTDRVLKIAHRQKLLGLVAGGLGGLVLGALAGAAFF